MGSLSAHVLLLFALFECVASVQDSGIESTDVDGVAAFNALFDPLETYVPGKYNSTADAEVDLVFNGVEHKYDGAGSVVLFSGYSSTTLCSKVSRKEPLGDKQCPITSDWEILWPAQEMKDEQCFVENIRSYYDESTKAINNAPGLDVWMGKCPPNTADEMKWAGGYDWRYGSIHPQQAPHTQLYPQIVAHIEDLVNKTGKKVIVKGTSGGTIASYGFLKSQTKKWVQDHVMAYVPVVPVFGGTVSSLLSVLYGWPRGAMKQCVSRQAAMFVPSVLWMWPRPGEDAYNWNKTEVLVETPSKNYTAYELEAMLDQMGLQSVKPLYKREKADLLDRFEPPYVDTYAFYGYDIPTFGGMAFDTDLTPEVFGTGGAEAGMPCPTKGPAQRTHAWDNGDGVGTRRSTARASQWSEAHKREGITLWNKGYQGMKHCDNCDPRAKKDYECLMSILAGKPAAGCEGFYK
eukprot:m.788166 g.788166  ORF g.788166 m.788166 type:complete len:461 (+) comp23314_c0_seq4:1973-3355(+)